MDDTTFLKNYRIRLSYDGSPLEPDRNGPAISYEAADQRTAEPVSVTLVPAESVDPAERERFEDNISVAQKLRHANVAKVLDFGREGDDYVYVSERLPGETLASWVRTHGPIPADAALRIGEQVVSVLSSANFHRLPYPSIQPSDIILVPGQTAEGTWPLVKLTNFGLPPLVAGTEAQSSPSQMPQQDVPGQQISNRQQFGQATRDVQSEIYSLGVTLYFLLTGVALSAEALGHGPNFSGFPKPLRNLLGSLLRRNPDQRPKDLLVVTEMMRQCSGKIERRRALSDRYGIPLRTGIPGRGRGRSRRLVQTALAIGTLLLLTAVIAPLVLPESVGKIIAVIRKPKPAGVLIGVPEPSAAATAPAPQSGATTPAAVVESQPVDPTVASQTEMQTNSTTTPNPFHVSPADVEQARIANAQPPAVLRTDPDGNVVGTTPDSSVSPASALTASSSAQANAEPAPTGASKSNLQAKDKSVASKSRPTRADQSSEKPLRSRTRSMRSRFVGITSDGRLILRLPSGRIAIVAPDEDSATPRHRSRAFIDRNDTFAPPRGFGPDYSPDD
jgi:serine/threonine protein kinase